MSPRDLLLCLIPTMIACSGTPPASPRTAPSPAGTSAGMSALMMRRAEVMARKPETERENVRVWTMRQTDHSRVNLVEMRGKLSYHRHPDAEHTLYVLEGRVCAWHGRDAVVLGVGDYFSIPAGLPHKYETLTPTALLLSFDAPAYDSKLTEPVPAVDLAACPE